MLHDHAASKTFGLESCPSRINPQGFYVVNGIAKECFLRRVDGATVLGGAGTFYVTGWELLHALCAKSFSGKILMGEVPESTINFKPYVHEYFGKKAEAETKGDKAGRLIAKIMLNSLYGKYAQRNDKFRSYVLMPLGSNITEVNRRRVANLSEPYTLHAEFDYAGLEVWSLPSKGGQLYNVATAASITGYVRAMLYKAIHETNPYYCDTDSILCDSKRAPSNLGDNLGQWSLEARGDLLYIAGKKLYAMRIVGTYDEKSAKMKGYYWDGKRAWKIASKGCRLNPEQMKTLCQGKTVHYKNDAPCYSLLNSPFFVERKITRTAIPAAS
jgi:hypothetical protein